MQASKIERELEVDAEAQEVWETVTGSHWLADEVELDLTPGGEARFCSGEEVKTGWVEDIREPSRLTFWWGVDGEPATRVELTLTPLIDGGTRLRVVESRPLDMLDLVGMPLRRAGGATFGPALVAA